VSGEPAWFEVNSQVIAAAESALQGRSDEAVRQCDEIVRRVGYENADAELRECVIRGLKLKATVLWQLGDTTEAVDVADEVIERFSADLEPIIRTAVASFISFKAKLRFEQDRMADVVALADLAIATVESLPGPEPRRELIGAMTAKASALFLSDQPDAARDVCDAIVAGFGFEPDPGIGLDLAEALLLKAQILCLQDSPADTVKVCDEVLDRLDPRAGKLPARRVRIAGTKPYIAGALFCKAQALRELKRPAQARRIYDEIVKRFDRSEDAGAQEIAKDARQELGRS
jgi:tetratricopeptide (TPR) repeat protein